MEIASPAIGGLQAVNQTTSVAWQQAGSTQMPGIMTQECIDKVKLGPEAPFSNNQDREKKSSMLDEKKLEDNADGIHRVPMRGSRMFV